MRIFRTAEIAATRDRFGFRDFAAGSDRRPIEFDNHARRGLGHERSLSQRQCGLSDGPGLFQVMKLERTVINKTTGENREETVYGVTSLPQLRAPREQLNELGRTLDD